MPYKSISDVPEKYRGNKDAAKMWLDVFNSAWKQYEGDSEQEAKAHATASAAVNKKYDMAEASERFEFLSLAPVMLGDQVLARGEVLRTGSWLYRGEEMQIVEEMIRQAFDNWKGHKRDVMLDYNHGSRIGKTPEEQKRAGDLVDLEIVAENGVTMLVGTFKPTEEAAGYIGKDEYKYLSAEFEQDYFHPEDKKNIGMYLQAVALTNRPYIEGMAPMVLMSQEAGELFTEYERSGSVTVQLADASKFSDFTKYVDDWDGGAKVVGWYQDVKLQSRLYAERVEPKKEEKVKTDHNLAGFVFDEKSPLGTARFREV